MILFHYTHKPNRIQNGEFTFKLFTSSRQTDSVSQGKQLNNLIIMKLFSNYILESYFDIFQILFGCIFSHNKVFQNY